MHHYNNIRRNQVCEILMQAAMGVAAVCGCRYTISDMVYSLSGLNITCKEKPYYVAIREEGTESGDKAECLRTCQSLGYPLVIAKIEMDKLGDCNMAIMFTHNWMDGDNNSMEQEFNSL